MYNQFEAITRNDAARILVDNYLYNKKAIRIKRMDDGSDYSTGGGIFPREDREYNSLINEIAMFKGDKWVDLDPTSDEFKQVIALRNVLVKGLLNANIFKESASAEVSEFGDYLRQNVNEKVSVKDPVTGRVVLISLVTLFFMLFSAGIGAELFSEDEKSHYDKNERFYDF